MKNKINFTKEYNFSNTSYSIHIEKNNSFSIDEINFILENYNYDKIKSVKEYFEAFFNLLNCALIDKASVLSNKMKSDYLNYLKSKLKSIDIFLCEYYKSIFPIRNMLLEKLKPLYIDKDKLEIPVYRHNTKTGRSRITSGTNYLTMKKEKRAVLKTTEDRILHEIDFSSCEPMFYFHFLGMKFENVDMYQKIKEELLIDIARDKLKLTIISILYGAGYETVKRNANISKKEYNKIKNYMKLDQFLKKIKTQGDVVFNFYGRPLIGTTSQNIINYWVQSSVADYVYLSFYQYSKHFKTFNFHAIIHDAMLFSIINFENDIVDKTFFLSEPISNFKIPVKIHKYSDI